jgi:hypothetical protein
MSEFNKVVFGELIEKAKGDRSINNYALHSGVDASHISRFIRGLVKNPPNPNTIKKLSDHAQNDVTYEKLMEAAGHIVYQQQDLFELDHNGAQIFKNDDLSLYQLMIISAKRQVQLNLSNHVIKKISILTAFNAFEIRLNEVLIKCFIKKNGVDEPKTLNYFNSISLKEKIEIQLQTYLDFDIAKEEYFKDLMNYLRIRDEILLGVYKETIPHRFTYMIIDVIQTTINIINQQALAKGIE